MEPCGASEIGNLSDALTFMVLKVALEMDSFSAQLLRARVSAKAMRTG